MWTGCSWWPTNDDDYTLPETLEDAVFQIDSHPEESLLNGCEVSIEKPTASRKTGKGDYVDGYLWERNTRKGASNLFAARKVFVVN